MTLEEKINVIYNWVLAQQGEQPVDIQNTAEEPAYIEIAEDILTDLGVSRSFNGFRYIAWAVEAVVIDEDKLRNISSVLYVDGGKRFNTSSKSFERGIRHAIDSTLHNSKNPTPEAIKLFGCDRNISEYSNKAVIATIAAEVKKRKRLRKFDI